MSSGSLSSLSGGAPAGRSTRSGFVTSTATYSADSSQAACATADRSSGPGYASSLRRYWSSSASSSGSDRSNPSSDPSSGGALPTRNAGAATGVGASISSSGTNGGRASSWPRNETEGSPSGSMTHSVVPKRWRSTPDLVSTSTLSPRERTA